MRTWDNSDEKYVTPTRKKDGKNLRTQNISFCLFFCSTGF
jgi:hypothetical protein